ncbi:hypothetical protein TG4357_03138 [Thalassovita gelatinovora]|uniref:Uncharacterized protein n=1 Tax=Thalassovita gelatinovora TaxID=53501 RepID=A0A0P1FIN4_THAGE|nr:hypothetical protein TG4357_03138 [Thalassovita gelatinovora]SEP69775.1 hypothetical protein SAMN04488043_101122 [Thalassovita gelatinovora]
MILIFLRLFMKCQRHMSFPQIQIWQIAEDVFKILWILNFANLSLLLAMLFIESTGKKF